VHWLIAFVILLLTCAVMPWIAVFY